MNKKLKALAGFVALMLIPLLAGCNNDGEYVIKGNNVFFSYWTFSFGTINDTLPEVNATRFESVKDWLGKDDKHVYFKERLIAGADPATIEAKKYPLCHDKRDYYYKGVPMHVSSVKNFEVVKWNEDDMWAIDGRYAFYDSLRIEPRDINSFKVQNWNVAVDSEHVYRYGKILPLADPATYVEEWNGFYSRDKSHIWYMGELIEDIDYATFTIDKDGAHDKHGHFYRGERVSEERWKEIKAQNDDL
ncbi:MAG: DKNYY domain-containing protein [Muribaculaceae bacterium]|nr:DKNYY domain-containing protein [Muribaculaceae bacterium]